MSELFGHLSDGRPVSVFTLANRSGVEVRLITFGAAIISCRTRDRNGLLADVALGFTDLASYVGHPAYFGAVVGRYANRISNAQFSIDGRTYTLAPTTVHITYTAAAGASTSTCGMQTPCRMKNTVASRSSVSVRIWRRDTLATCTSRCDTH